MNGEQMKAYLKEHMKPLNLGNKITWVSVDEMMPPPDVIVLVKNDGFLPYAAMIKDGKWDDFEGQPPSGLKITHWTELP
jgi:hypothetical protein